MRTLLIAMCLCCSAARADWLDSDAAKEFRERVIQLALIYGDSSGIDLQGYKVDTREVQKLGNVCSYVEVKTSKDGKEVRRETVRACKAH
ncbi:MAG TPA: hypothetical protein VMZ74_08315 [Ramlibacter sp.]|nr:hypothetical protein [Ramlibacter sp.]